MQYAAFIRGIGPGNPNMRGEKLKETFESLGFTDVHVLLSSGNLVFSTKSKNMEALESTIEKALEKQLGFSRSVIIRSKEELEELIVRDPFKGKVHGKESYLLVTFFKDRTKVKDGMIITALNMKDLDGPEMMRDIEKKYGKEITSRTWLTIQRIVKKFE